MCGFSCTNNYNGYGGYIPTFVTNFFGKRHVHTKENDIVMLEDDDRKWAGEMQDMDPKPALSTKDVHLYPGSVIYDLSVARRSSVAQAVLLRRPADVLAESPISYRTTFFTDFATPSVRFFFLSWSLEVCYQLPL